jgi:hypothetical protein
MFFLGKLKTAQKTNGKTMENRPDFNGKTTPMTARNGKNGMRRRKPWSLDP